MKKQNQGKVRFARIRGRIVPIRSKKGSKRNKNVSAARSIVSTKNIKELGAIGGAIGLGLGGLFTAGRMSRKANSLFKSTKTLRKAKSINRVAKFTKFGSKAVPALVVGSALTAIDRRTKDEGTLFDIGNTSGAANVATTLALGYTATRLGKRFEKFGLRGGKFPIKLKDI